MPTIPPEDPDSAQRGQWSIPTSETNMMATRFLLFASCLLLGSCIPAKIVTLSGEAGEHYEGHLAYDDPFSGTLRVEKGPGGERFSGRFVVVDRTATQQSQGTLLMPQVEQLPAMGSATNVSSGGVDATGHWFATGDKGSRMECQLLVGRGGHGQGECLHNNGKRYRILL